MFNKPSGYLTAKSDANRPTVMEFFPPELAGKIHPVGRLDRDTEGLLLFTDDGRIDPVLLHPSRHVEKKYFFRCFGEVSEEGKRKAEQGIELFGNGFAAAPCGIDIIRRTSVEEVSTLLPEYKKGKYLRNPSGAVTEGTVTVTEGKKHEVKLILKSIGCHVFYLKRIEFASLKLDETLSPGQYRELFQYELDMIMSDVK